MPHQDHRHPYDASISVIIPALNECERLPANLADVLRQRGVRECIVVDGGSDDGTAALVAAHPDPRVRLLRSPAGRGRQLNAGAREAVGDWLLFHHADSRLPADAGQLLQALQHQPAVRWGGFRHRFSDANWKLSSISFLHNARCRLSGAVYGDQSMFARRDFFWHVGGFPDDGLEDLVFSDRALAHCRPHLARSHVVTDSRKFRAIGEFRALRQVVSIVRRYESQRALGNEEFFRPYR